MTILEAVEKRHSVRSYKAEPLKEEDATQLKEWIKEINEESGLHIQLIENEPEAFTGLLAHYGGFKNVTSYIALVGKKTDDLDEKCGYYGEKLVLLAETIGLSTCWVGGTFKKGKAKYELNDGEKLSLVISIGYAQDEGKAHRSKTIQEVSKVDGDMPAWFEAGVVCALKAPTAINQQKFFFTLVGEDGVIAETKSGPYTKVDLGIAKYHFEIGAGKENFRWV